MRKISHLEPKDVFTYFEDISQIPRGSGKTDAVREYCIEYAKANGFEYIADEAGNIIIFAPASQGRETEEPVIIQGHLDMVWEKDAGCDINFETEGLRLETDGEYVWADGTTLGGDDGIAVAMCLALMAGDYSHPPIEAVFTTDEETGMTGAAALDCSPLRGRRMINLDSEAEGILWVSCAGGARVDIDVPLTHSPVESSCLEISISGLHGGHSGGEIHIGYASANRLMARLLSRLYTSLPFHLVSVCGGTMTNAITRESTCVIVTDYPESAEKIKDIFSDFVSEYRDLEPNMTVSIRESKTDSAADFEGTLKAVNLLAELPYGVQEMSADIEGLVHTSLNLGTLETVQGVIRAGYSVRGMSDSGRRALTLKICTIAEKYGASYRIHGEYPAWEYKKESPLRDAVAACFREQYGKEPEITAVHAGLECGLFCGKIPGLDCVSVGPDILDIHTPCERLSVPSCRRTWTLLLGILKQI